MATSRLIQPGSFGRCLDPFLAYGFVQMMASTYTGPRVNADLGSGKYPLPAPFLVGIWILPFKRIRQIDFAKTTFDILLMYLTVVFQVGNERFTGGGIVNDIDSLYQKNKKSRDFLGIYEERRGVNEC